MQRPITIRLFFGLKNPPLDQKYSCCCCFSITVKTVPNVSKAASLTKKSLCQNLMMKLGYLLTNITKSHGLSIERIK